MADRPPDYRLRPQAEDDLEEIWQYTLNRWSLEQADAYIRMIINAFAGLTAGTKQARPVEVREGYFKFAAGSHVIYFVRTDPGVEIVRVLHGRMDVDRQL